LDSNLRNTFLYNCINYWLEIDVRDVPILYVNDTEYFLCIKKNFTITFDKKRNIDFLIELFRFVCEITPGLYKHDEKKIYIKFKEKNDLCLLLTELLHSKSITQYYKEIDEWIREGLPHYLAKLLCEKCKIQYIESSHSEYFDAWAFIYEKYGLSVLRNILFCSDIRITKGILKSIMNYDKDDILEISFQKAKELMDID